MIRHAVFTTGAVAVLSLALGPPVKGGCRGNRVGTRGANH